MYALYADHVTFDGNWIPLDIENADFQQYEDWVAAGNTPNPEPKPSIPELIYDALAETRMQRQPIISILDGLQASALAVGDTPKAQVIETAKQALRDITTTNLTDCTTRAQMRAKIMARYLQIASASPALKAAFSEALK